MPWWLSGSYDACIFLDNAYYSSLITFFSRFVFVNEQRNFKSRTLSFNSFIFSLFSFRILLRQEVMFYLRSSLPPGESFQKTIRSKLLLPSWFPWKPPDFTLQTTWKRKNLLCPQMRISVSCSFILITWFCYLIIMED